MSKGRKVVIINQAANYLTIGFANAFNQEFEEVVLITGSVHSQGEELAENIQIKYINKYQESPSFKKMISYLIALLNMWWLLITKYPKHEVFFVSAPPMGYLLNLVLPHRFSMVIWDVYPDAFQITGMKSTHLVYKTWAYLNKISFKKAFKLFTISEKMAELLNQYVDANKPIIQPIWSIFQVNNRVTKTENLFVKEHGLEGKFVVQYSGNIGLTHNVESLIAIAEKLQDTGYVVFQIIGRGARKHVLERLVKERNLSNCQFLPFQSDEMFPYSLSAADLGVVILDETTSKGSVPSKSYNLMSYGIPSLYIASEDSQLKAYCDEYGHAKCFSKADLDLAAEFITSLSLDDKLHQLMSSKALKASDDFKRINADKFIYKYLNK
jgi:hypothetical protein